jgi:ABC-type branched-subunit amino acid transport system substrate-binding protein
MTTDFLRPKPPVVRRTWFWVTVGAVLVLLGGAVLGYIVFVKDACDADGVVQGPGDQCVGVTNGSFHFARALRNVDQKILDENRRVDGLRKPAVSLAYLLAIPKNDADAEGAQELDSLRREMEGAYLAQRRANQTNALGDLPLIRLLIASDGDKSAGWEQAVQQLLAKVGGPDRLVAVAGLGESRTETRQAVDALAAHNIPMVGSVITSDAFATGPQGPIRGLARVAPVNTDQVKAAVAFLRTRARTALLVQDVRQSDLYGKTLGSAFQQVFPDGKGGHTLIGRVEQYDSSLDGVANTFVQMMPNLCQQHPDVVFFAGRGNELAKFLQALSERQCVATVPIHIMTGDDATSLANLLRREQTANRAEIASGLKANATLRYTALAHPGAWTANPKAFSSALVSYFRDSCDHCFPRLFPGESLDDGQAIMGHDAVALAIWAIRHAVTSSEPQPAPAAVVQALYRAHGELAVSSASGLISVGEDGSPTNKPVPILELRPDGGVSFVELSSPTGTPFH